MALQCLTEIGSLQMTPEFDPHFAQFFRVFMGQLAAVLPPGTDIARAYEHGSDEQQAFVQNLALFFTGFFRARSAPRALLPPHAAATAALRCGCCSLLAAPSLPTPCPDPHTLENPPLAFRTLLSPSNPPPQNPSNTTL